MICAAMIAAVPAYWLFTDPPEFIGLEKRYRAGWPEFSGSQFLSGKWGERVESWMKDRIPARDFLVGVDSYIWYFSGRQAARDVFTDGAGGLFDEPAEYAAGDLMKRLDKIAVFTASLNAAQAGEASKDQPDVSCVVLIPPEPGYVARLPRRLKNLYNDDAIADAVIAYAGAQATEKGAVMTYVDLRQKFLEKGTDAYYKTDHHWNGSGAYAAYTELGGVLGYEPLPRDAFTIDTVGDFYGSVYAKSGLWLTGPDKIELWSPPYPLRVTVVNDSKEPEIRDTPFFNEYLTDWDMYSTFLGGINGLTIVDNPGYAAGDTLFVVKDSYANSLIPLLAANYNRIVAVDLRRYRGAAGDLLLEYGVSGEKNVFLFVYSMDHIANDPDLLWLR